MTGEYTTPAFESLADGIAVVDAHGATVTANDAWRAFLEETGIDPSVTRTASTYLQTLLDADRSPTAASDLDVVLTLPYQASSDAYSHRLRVGPFTHDGELFATLTAVGEESPTVTPLKTRAMDEAPVGITISDYTRPGNPLVYANAAFERITGYDVVNTLGRNCRFLQSADTDPDAVAEFREAIRANEGTTVELRNERADGEEFWNAVTIAPLRDATGEVTNWVGFQQDVTARKRAEEALNSERDQYALLNQIIRHDIRNDMTVVQGWGRELRDGLSADQREILTRVLDAAAHTAALTEDVRDLTEIMGDEDPTLEPISLGAVLLEEIDQVRSTFEYQADDLVVEGPEEMPAVRVLGTPLLSSVFTNVLDNAVFHNDSDEVRIDVGVAVDEETCTVSVADNGPGISDAQKREVFEYGEQGLDSSGTGLGLYLVDQLVDQFGGRVWVEDNEPRGAVVRIELQRV
ncbi:PAS domain-containing protein [Halocalculus aciditolerans]|uniref:PAS domain S-box-containing protein n=1 Tax=Halocalculus aciditolerans TaxID=1383812 RepID=A0A830FK84_9EURY|nr:PAS domain-containing protein [Halocalculus aciditolerans]GGL64119.1 hypothetical protein GCM10009039_22450 [Halocalculus aciditolerans]